MDLFWLDDAQWEAVAAHLPTKQPGPKRLNDRIVISGIIHVLWSGCAWRDCPSEYGPYMTVFNRFNRWKNRGIWHRIFNALTTDNRLPPLLMSDGSQLEAALAARTRSRSPRRGSNPAASSHGDAASAKAARVPARVPAQIPAYVWNIATSQLEELARAHAGKPIAAWIDAVVEWHMDSLFGQEEQAWVPGMAGEQDPFVEKAVERFNRHSFKTTVARLSAETADLRKKLQTALACIGHYADNPAINGPDAKAKLQSLVDELSKPSETKPALQSMAS